MATGAEVWSSLTAGEIEIEGRLDGSSNGALLVMTSLDDIAVSAIYKPMAFERPLWDFPDHTLGRREVAAGIVSDALGWDLVPPTVWRTEGPMGPGMCQLWIDSKPVEFVSIFAGTEVPTGWLPVLAAHDSDGDPVVLAHRDDDALRHVALFDIVTNNADRKVGHLLSRTGDLTGVHSVDHGLTFHLDAKLRTVLWGFAGQFIAPDLIAPIEKFAADEGLALKLTELLGESEVVATRNRATALLADPRFPHPPQDRNPIPWPLV